MATWVDDMHHQQDEQLRMMVEMWKRDERLRPFDLYFRWKTGEVSTDVWRASRAEICRMRCETKRILDELWDENMNCSDPSLERVVDAIDDELITVSQIIGLY